LAKDAKPPAAASGEYAVTTPREVARAYNAAANAGDLCRALQLADASTELRRDLVRSVVNVGSALERLRKAVADRFGADTEYELEFGLPYDEEFDDAAERIDGDRAFVIMAGDAKHARRPEDAQGTTRLVRLGGRWLVVPEPPDADQRAGKEPADEEIRAAIVMNQVFARSARLTLEKLKSGAFSEPSDVSGSLVDLPFSDPDAFKDLVPPEAQKQ
jgi:hypothetical protein